MKKLISAVLLFALMLALGTVAFAAPSPTPAPTPTPEVTTPTETTVPGLYIIKGFGVLSSWDGNGGVAVANKITELNGQLLTMFNLKGTGEFILGVPGVLANQNYVVLHYNGTSVDVIYPSEISAGRITFTVTENSPFAIVAVPGIVKSPKTSAY